MIRLLFIDMDDTLYDEGSYVLSGFRAVAEAVAARFPGAEADALYGDMIAELTAKGRGRVFDAALAGAGIAADPALIADLVEAYRAHKPTLSLWPGVSDALADLRRDHHLAVVTDGQGTMQRNKAEALGLAERVDELVYCWEHQAPKPEPGCYHRVLEAQGVCADQAVVIGDRPDHDMAAAKAVGCRSIRVRTGRYAAVESGAFEADATVADFTQASGVLRDWRQGATR